MHGLNVLITVDEGFCIVTTEPNDVLYIPIKLHTNPIATEVGATWLILVGPKTVCKMASKTIHELIYYKSKTLVKDLVQLRNEVPDFNYCFINDNGDCWNYGGWHLANEIPLHMNFIEMTDTKGSIFGIGDLSCFNTLESHTKMEVAEQLIIMKTESDTEASNINIMHYTKDLICKITLGSIRRKYNVGSDLEDHVVVPSSAFKGSF